MASDRFVPAPVPTPYDRCNRLKSYSPWKTSPEVFRAREEQELFWAETSLACQRPRRARLVYGLNEPRGRSRPTTACGSFTVLRTRPICPGPLCLNDLRVFCGLEDQTNPSKSSVPKRPSGLSRSRRPLGRPRCRPPTCRLPGSRCLLPLPACLPPRIIGPFTLNY